MNALQSDFTKWFKAEDRVYFIARKREEHYEFCIGHAMDGTLVAHPMVHKAILFHDREEAQRYLGAWNIIGWDLIEAIRTLSMEGAR